jgi:ABC-type nitrate/sulfonate/bicarbonate transport system substrate-binding protein
MPTSWDCERTAKAKTGEPIVEKIKDLLEVKMKLLTFALSICVSPLFFLSGARAERIRTAIPQANLNYLSVYVADAKGYFKEEGLENETLVMTPLLATAALISGDLDFSGAGGNGMRAAAKGAPLKGIMYQTEKVTFYLVVGPWITKRSELKGKKVAVGTVGDTQDTLITMFAERSGVPASDITRIAMGPSTPARIAAVKTKSVDATTVDDVGDVLAERQGLVTMAYLGDLFPYPFQGFVTTDKKIAEKPEQIKRWLRAMVRALLFLRERPQESIDLAGRKLDLGKTDRSLMLESLKRYLKSMPAGIPGMPSAEGIKNALEYDVRVPLGIKEQIPIEKVLNLRFIEEVKREFESKQHSR